MSTTRFTPPAGRFPTIVSARPDITRRHPDGYEAEYRNLYFIVSERLELDGQWWTHASVSRKDRTMPTWADIWTLKEFTIGPERVAMQLFVSDDEHVNTAGNDPHTPVEVLHLWSPPKNQFLPEFDSWQWYGSHWGDFDDDKLHYWLSMPVRPLDHPKQPRTIPLYPSYQRAWRKAIVTRVDGQTPVWYDEAKALKRQRLGFNRVAIQVFGREVKIKLEERLKQTQRQVTLYTPDNNPFPDFRRGLDTI